MGPFLLDQFMDIKELELIHTLGVPQKYSKLDNGDTFIFQWEVSHIVNCHNKGYSTKDIDYICIFYKDEGDHEHNYRSKGKLVWDNRKFPRKIGNIRGTCCLNSWVYKV